MEPKKLPGEAIEAYNLFIHGEIDRRAFMDRVKKVAVSARGGRGDGRPADAELRGGAAGVADRRAHQDRVRDRAVAARQRQHQGLPRAAGERRHAAGCPRILVIHENRGLNPHIEDVARRLALENFMAFAPDGLTSVGGYPGRRREGRRAVRQGRSREDGRGPLRRGRVAEERVPTAPASSA